MPVLSPTCEKLSSAAQDANTVVLESQAVTHCSVDAGCSKLSLPMGWLVSLQKYSEIVIDSRVAFRIVKASAGGDTYHVSRIVCD